MRSVLGGGAGLTDACKTKFSVAVSDARLSSVAVLVRKRKSTVAPFKYFNSRVTNTVNNTRSP